MNAVEGYSEVWLDSCCGHPQQSGVYHYHKYPNCVKSPFKDDGTQHSPVLGFAFDGFPLYGPYESDGVMAKDLKKSAALDVCNGHIDEIRGYHYHVQFELDPNQAVERRLPDGGGINGDCPQWVRVRCEVLETQLGKLAKRYLPFSGVFVMKRCIWTFGFMIVMGATTVMAQPPGGQGGRGGGGGFRSPLMEALDADHDGVISAAEIKNATASLITLDKDKDGKLSEEEIRPAGRGPGAGGPGGGGPGGEGRGPGGEGRGPGGEGRGPGGEGRGPGGEGRGPGAEGRGPGGPGGNQRLAISPDRMLTHAMEFDADKDEKLGKDELQKFIADFMQRHGNQAGGGEGRGPGGGRDGGPGGAGGGRGGPAD